MILSNLPKTKLGKWSVALQGLFLISVILSIFLVKIIHVLRFDDHWWDITAVIAFPASILATITGIIAKKKKDDSIFVILSVILGLLVIVFIFTHSLFISD